MEGLDPGAQWLGSLSDIGGPTRLLDPIMKWAITVRTPVTMADTIHRGACQIAMSLPRGPVLVNTPLEFMLQKIAVDRIPAPAIQTAVPQADLAILEQVGYMLLDARDPVLLTGSAGQDPRAMGHLIELAELLALPIVEAPAPEFTNFPTSHPLHQGYETRPFLAKADVILLVESSTPWHPPSQGPDPECRVIEMSVDPYRRLKPYSGYPCHVQVAGNVTTNLKGLVEAVRAMRPGNGSLAAHLKTRASSLQATHQQRHTNVREEALSARESYPIEPAWLCYALNETIPDDAIVVAELIVHRRVLDRYLERTRPGSYMRSFGGLGQGLPNALGMKLAHRDRLVVALVGDGSFNYNPVLACYGMCQEYSLPILTVIFNNDGYVSQQRHLEEFYPEGFGARGGGQNLATIIRPRPDYPKLIEAFGGWGRAISHPQEIIPAIRKGIEEVQDGRPALVDVSLAW